MMYLTASVAVRIRASSILAMFAVALTIGPHVYAQQPPTNPPVPPAQAAPEPNTGQTHQAAPTETVQNGQQQVQVIFSPWTKYCAKGPTGQSSEIRTKEVCFTAADGHLASGQKLVIALLIEPEGSDTRLLRVTLPLGVALVPGARIVIDQNEAMTAPFVVCLPQNGCMADYKADGDLIEKLKNAQSLAIQAFDRGKPVSFNLPLAGFAKAYEGPAENPTILNQLQHLDTPGGK
jgi:invasion protein IalB